MMSSIGERRIKSIDSKDKHSRKDEAPLQAYHLLLTDREALPVRPAMHPQNNLHPEVFIVATACSVVSACTCGGVSATRVRDRQRCGRTCDSSARDRPQELSLHRSKAAAVRLAAAYTLVQSSRALGVPTRKYPHRRDR